MRGKRRFAAATTVALAMVATMAACGGDDSDSASSSETTATTAAGSGGSSTTAGSTATTAAKAQPASMDDWEKLWADQRAAQLKRIKDNKWGTSADGKTVTGPEGFTMDLSKCPAGWSQTEGLTDTSMKIGLSLAQSGNYAEYNNYSKSMK